MQPFDSDLMATNLRPIMNAVDKHTVEDMIQKAIREHLVHDIAAEITKYDSKTFLNCFNQACDRYCAMPIMDYYTFMVCSPDEEQEQDYPDFSVVYAFRERCNIIMLAFVSRCRCRLQSAILATLKEDATILEIKSSSNASEMKVIIKNTCRTLRGLPLLAGGRSFQKECFEELFRMQYFRYNSPRCTRSQSTVNGAEGSYCKVLMALHSFIIDLQ